jgi:hypothetical protein
MIPQSKSLVAPRLLKIAALSLVALAGAVAAVPASARSFEGHGGWGNDRGHVERGYGPAYDEGYRPEWRPVRAYGPMMAWHGHHEHR